MNIQQFVGVASQDNIQGSVVGDALEGEVQRRKTVVLDGDGRQRVDTRLVPPEIAPNLRVKRQPLNRRIGSTIAVATVDVQPAPVP